MHLSSHIRLMALLALLDPTTMGSLHHTSLTSTAILTICHQHSLDVDGFHATAHCAFTKAAVISAAEVEFDSIIVNLSAQTCIAFHKAQSNALGDSAFKGGANRGSQKAFAGPEGIYHNQIEANGY
jgi:hypothetical protein